jgi:hypothetical protein
LRVAGKSVLAHTMGDALLSFGQLPRTPSSSPFLVRLHTPFTVRNGGGEEFLPFVMPYTHEFSAKLETWTPERKQDKERESSIERAHLRKHK